MTGELDGRVALVVGPSETVDAIAAAFADAGCEVIVASTANTAGAPRSAAGIERLDASRDELLPGLAGQARAAAGRLDILVQHHPTMARRLANAIPVVSWSRDLARVTAAWQVACGFAAIAEPGAAIVNVISMDAPTSYPGRVTAAVAANATEALTRSLAVEWATIPIRVNAVAHGVLLTEADRAAIESGDKSLDRILLRAPGHRLGDVDELASLVRFLVGPGSQFITGQTIAADVGWAALTQHPEGLRFP